jgi:hypothetical protein
MTLRRPSLTSACGVPIIARAFAEEASAIYKGRAPETGDMNS